MISLMMLFSAFLYVTSPDLTAAFKHLGFPGYFRIELAVLKFLGVLALLIPMIPGRIKEFAYFGFFLNFVSAIVAHSSVGDPAAQWAGGLLVALVLLITSYLMYQRIQANKVVE